jgi:hypothetical protein
MVTIREILEDAATFSREVETRPYVFVKKATVMKVDFDIL